MNSINFFQEPWLMKTNSIKILYESRLILLKIYKNIFMSVYRIDPRTIFIRNIKIFKTENALFYVKGIGMKSYKISKNKDS